MKNVHENIASCVGNTPAVKLNRVTRLFEASVYAKLEYLNPGGSLKDRLAQSIIREAENNGRLVPGGTIIERTTGNMGVALAMAAATRGYRSIFVVPDRQSDETRAALRSYGARVVVTPANAEPDDPRSANMVAMRLAQETPRSYYVDQYRTEINPNVHYSSTGPEIWEQFDGQIDVFITGIGTGGTISGVGRYIKERSPETTIVGVDPVGSVIYDFFHTRHITTAQPFMVEGIGSSFVPATLDIDVIDNIFRINDKESFQMARKLLREEGIFVGGSSGATVAGAIKYLRQNDRKGLKVVLLLPDSGARYLSRIFDDNWMRDNGFLDPDPGLGTVGELLLDLGERELFTVDSRARVPEVIAILKLHGISQVPVMKGGRLLGILSENQLLERTLRGGSPGARAGDLAETAYFTVDRETELSVLLNLFRQSRVAIVMEDGRPASIVARIDVIDFISRNKAPVVEP